ncbi:MAG: Bug family tripartite tricarboxylate transporter substrate binding protein [Burkholderiaceae bacterium]
MFRPSILCALAIACSLGLPGAGASEAPYPSKPVRLVVPYPPGGGTDIVARLLADRLRERLGQTVVIENKPGANGIIGADMVARAPADGYTLLLGGIGPLAVNPSLMPQTPYVPDQAFTAIVKVSSVPFVLVTGPSAPATELQKLLAYARSNSGKLTAANAGEGSPQHLCVSLLARRAGVSFVDIPYKGAAPAINDLLGGSVHVICENVGTIRPFVQAGKVRPLAVSTSERVSLMPDVPSFKEQGIADIDFSAWFMLVAPARTPAAVVELLNREVNAVLRQPDFVARMQEVANQPLGGSVQAASDFLARENREWPPILKSIYPGR